MQDSCVRLRQQRARAERPKSRFEEVSRESREGRGNWAGTWDRKGRKEDNVKTGKGGVRVSALAKIFGREGEDGDMQRSENESVKLSPIPYLLLFLLFRPVLSVNR